MPAGHLAGSLGIRLISVTVDLLTRNGVNDFDVFSLYRHSDRFGIAWVVEANLNVKTLITFSLCLYDC